MEKYWSQPKAFMVGVRRVTFKIYSRFEITKIYEQQGVVDGIVEYKIMKTASFWLGVHQNAAGK